MAGNSMPLDRIDEIMRAVFNHLKSVGGSANGSDVLTAIAPSLSLSPYELEHTKKGRERWITHIRFYTTDCVKAGFLTKSNGVWTLTPAGESALSLPPGKLIRTANKAYRTARKQQPAEIAGDDLPETESVERQVVYEQAKEQARKEIDEHINNLGPYDFQKLVAELLMGMGYHVPYIAPPGPDGGIDIVAYKDPLGTADPRIRVQVKHRETKVDVKEVRELEGILRKESDIGLIVSSGGFTNEALRETRVCNKHIETMDLSRLINLWQDHYLKISESGKALLPLVKVFFLAPAEDE